MIWLTWRQHRKQGLFALVGLAAIAAVLVPIGLAMRKAYNASGLPACLATMGQTELIPVGERACQALMNQFNNEYSNVAFANVLFLVLPLLVGLFWGAPMISREVEHGTHRLIWTQGISRSRWAWVKIGFVGGGALLVATVYGLGMSWFMEPLAKTGEVGGLGRLNYLMFDMQGVAPVGYTLFVVALGVFAGTIWQKVMPAMAVTLAAFVGVRFVLTVFARQHLVPARTITLPLTGVTEVPNPAVVEWIVARGIRDGSGKLVAPGAEAVCPPGSLGPGCTNAWGPGAYNWIVYQPAERFWLIQGIETGIYVVLAALLLFLAVRRIQRIA